MPVDKILEAELASEPKMEQVVDFAQAQEVSFIQGLDQVPEPKMKEMIDFVQAEEVSFI